ncbi:helix-turn-helix domain-containing protein [Chloroflexota bacterium]
MLNLKQVSRLLNVHPNTLRRWSDNGSIKAYRIGPRGDRRYSKREIRQYLDEQLVPP